MVREQVLEDGLLIIDSMRAFRRSTSTRSANIPSSIEEDEGVCQNFQDRKLPDKSSCTIGLLVLPDE